MMESQKNGQKDNSPPRAGDGGAAGAQKKKKISLPMVRYAFRTIIWPRRWRLAAGLLLIAINQLSGLVLPGSTKYLLDEVIPHRNLILLYWLLGIVGAAALIGAVSRYALAHVLSIEAQHLIKQLREKIYQHVVYLPTRFFDNHASGALVSRIMSDVEGVRELVGTGIMNFFGSILTSLAALVIMLTISPGMTLYVLLPMLLFGGIIFKFFSYMRPVFRKRREINAEVTGRLTESLGGIRIVKGFRAEPQEIRVFGDGVFRLFQVIRQTIVAFSLFASSGSLVLGITGIVIMGVGGTKIMAGEITVGDFVAFTLYLAYLVAPIAQLSAVGNSITDAFAGLDRMEEVLRELKEGEEPGRTVSLTGLRGDIAFHNVSFAYEPDKPVIRNISFHAPAGTVTALVGSSGSGKSTIAGLVAAFLKPDEGGITVDGIDLATVKLSSYRRHLGVVLQDDFLFEGTIRENILFSRPAARAEELQTAIAAAHVKEFVDRFEKGLETVVGERGIKLSGGQRQRVAIARALLADPKILILDEATSNLDAESEAYIQDSLARLMRGRTTFVIAHRLSTIRIADQILVIEDGEIAERGTHDELIDREGRYSQLYHRQVRI